MLKQDLNRTVPALKHPLNSVQFQVSLSPVFPVLHQFYSCSHLVLIQILSSFAADYILFNSSSSLVFFVQFHSTFWSSSVPGLLSFVHPMVLVQFWPVFHFFQFTYFFVFVLFFAACHFFSSLHFCLCSLSVILLYLRICYNS